MWQKTSGKSAGLEVVRLRKGCPVMLLQNNMHEYPQMVNGLLSHVVDLFDDFKSITLTVDIYSTDFSGDYFYYFL